MVKGEAQEALVVSTCQGPADFKSQPYHSWHHCTANPLSLVAGQLFEDSSHYAVRAAPRSVSDCLPIGGSDFLCL